MKTPDKIYIQEGAIVRTEKTFDNDVEYIRKDSLLEHKKARKKMSYKEWLAKYGYEDCAGCEFNDIRHARCTYPGKWCVLYVRYRKDSE